MAVTLERGNENRSDRRPGRARRGRLAGTDAGQPVRLLAIKFERATVPVVAPPGLSP